MEWLADLDRAMAAERYAEALAVAVDAWQVHRDATLADLVEALAQALPPRYFRFHAEDDAFETAYVTAARDRDPGVTTALASSLRRSPHPDREKHPQNPLRYAAWHARLEALAARPRDPRVATALARMIGAAPPWVTTESWRHVFPPRFDRLLVDHADRRVMALMTQRAHRVTDKEWQAASEVRHAHTQRLIEAVETASRSFVRLDRPTLRALGPHVATAQSRARTRERDALDAFRTVLADDDRLDALAVYADALLAEGDPWGELILLSLSERRSPLSPEGAHAKERLLDEHEERWLGAPLADALTDRVWEDGVLVEASLLESNVEVALTAIRGPTGPERVDPRVANVRRLRADDLNRHALLAVAGAALLPALRVLDLGDIEHRRGGVVDALARTSLPGIEAIRCGAVAWHSHVLGLVGAASRHDDLRTLELRWTGSRAQLEDELRDYLATNPLRRTLTVEIEAEGAYLVVTGGKLASAHPG